MPRTKIPRNVITNVLIEAGYRCAVPACRNILAIDLHHIIEVKEGGLNEESNLLALCPTCHALYTRGTISKEAIDAWKTMLVTLNHAFDQESISNLLFLSKITNEMKKNLRAAFDDNLDLGLPIDEDDLEDLEHNNISLMELISRLYSVEGNYPISELNTLLVSGDGVLKFSHLIATGLASYRVVILSHKSPLLYFVLLTEKGEKIIKAWFSGNRNAIKHALAFLPNE